MKYPKSKPNARSVELLTCSAETYVSSVRKSLKDYSLKDINSLEPIDSFSHDKKGFILENMLSNALDLNAEVVTNLIISGYDGTAYGTALIPKKK